MVKRRGRWQQSFAALLVLSMVAGACGDDDDDAADAGAGADTSAAEEAESAAAEDDPEAALAELVAAAEEEGSVTIYSGQSLDQLNALAAAFEAEYPGVGVEVVRLVDTDIIPRVETEISTGTSGGDLIISSALEWLQGQADAGNFVDPTASPQLAGLGDYDADAYLHEGNYFETAAAVLTFAWNTDLVPEGLTDYPDLLDPSLAGGKIAVVDPAISSAVVDFYLFLEENYGEDYVADLAAQEPRIYPGALPIGEALASGEVFAAAYAAPATLVPAQANGAPVDFGIGEFGVWGSRFYGAIPVSSDSPNAGALLADFILTPAGQEAVTSNSGSVLPGIPGSLVTVDQVREHDLEAIATEPAAEYVQEWNSLFR